ncbi:heavy-metal-associated domain-containing protein [Cellulosimicrobium funkei]|uniref:heavy-metal-associated domain-containing protein n=1 Tax=Cellulosimicrobium funkei TaxID=264251 RepID=UPI0034347BC7
MKTKMYRVWGLTCEVCLARLLEQVRHLAGVRTVAVDLVRDGESRLALTASPALAPRAVRAAVEDAGFSLSAPAATSAASMEV